MPLRRAAMVARTTRPQGGRAACVQQKVAFANFKLSVSMQCRLSMRQHCQCRSAACTGWLIADVSLTSTGDAGEGWVTAVASPYKRASSSSGRADAARRAHTAGVTGTQSRRARWTHHHAQGGHRARACSIPAADRPRAVVAAA